MSFILIVLTFFTAINSHSKENLCVVLKEQTEYSTFTKKLRESFNFKINKTIYNVIDIKHNSNMKSLQNAASIIRSNDCKIIWGGATSANSIKLLNMINDLDFKFVTPTSSSIKIRQMHKDTVYMSHNDDEISLAIANKVLQIEGEILLIRNLSFPNTEYISSEVASILKSKDRNIKIYNTFKGDDFSSLEINNPQIIIVPSYEKDLIKVHNKVKSSQNITFIGIDGWGSNKNIFNKFVQNDNHFNSIKLSYWRNSNCEQKEFKNLCEKFKLKTGYEFDSFSAIGYDSAVYINYLSTQQIEKTLTELKFDKENHNIKHAHFYSINKNGIKYMDRKNGRN